MTFLVLDGTLQSRIDEGLIEISFGSIQSILFLMELNELEFIL